MGQQTYTDSETHKKYEDFKKYQQLKQAAYEKHFGYPAPTANDADYGTSAYFARVNEYLDFTIPK